MVAVGLSEVQLLSASVTRVTRLKVVTTVECLSDDIRRSSLYQQVTWNSPMTLPWASFHKRMASGVAASFVWQLCFCK